MKLSGILLRNLLAVVFVLAGAIAMEAQAACNSTVNGYPMPWNECQAACEIYGSYPNGDYLRDRQGNWVNKNNPSERGNIYRDARFSRGCSDYDSSPDTQGCTTPGWFGSVCYW